MIDREVLVMHDPQCYMPTSDHPGVACFGDLVKARADERERIATIMDMRADIANQQAKTHNNRLYNELADAYKSAARVARDHTIGPPLIPKGSLNLPLPPGYHAET